MQSVQYQESIGLLIATLITPIIAVVLTLLIRWRHRLYFVSLILVGTSISVGAYPYDDPSIFGRLFKSFAEGSSFGLALRSTPRAVPLVVLGIAVLIGAGISALSVASSGGNDCCGNGGTFGSNQSCSFGAGRFGIR